MVRNVGYIGWKESLVLIVDPHRNICPPEKGLRQWSAVVEPDSGLDYSLSRTEVDADHAFHSQHGIVLAKPYSAASIGMLFYR